MQHDDSDRGSHRASNASDTSDRCAANACAADRDGHSSHCDGSPAHSNQHRRPTDRNANGGAADQDLYALARPAYGNPCPAHGNTRTADSDTRAADSHQGSSRANEKTRRGRNQSAARRRQGIYRDVEARYGL